MCRPTSRILIIHLIAVICGHRTNTQKIPFDTVVSFGDSNTDTGNVYNMTNYRFPPVPFFQGRFSNGPVWVEKLGVSNLMNYAYGSATTDNDVVQGFIASIALRVPGVRQQILNYSKNMNTSKINFQRTLYIIWAGGNDYLSNANFSVSTVVSSLSNATKQLLILGAKHLVVFNQPPLQAIPFIQTLGQTAYFSTLSLQYNANLSANIAILQRDNTQISLKVFDLYALVSKILANSSLYSLNNTADACWNASSNSTRICSNPASYVFFDDTHFTSRMHELIADGFRQFLTSSSWKRRFSFSFLAFYLWILFFHLHSGFNQI